MALLLKNWKPSIVRIFQNLWPFNPPTVLQKEMAWSWSNLWKSLLSSQEVFVIHRKNSRVQSHNFSGFTCLKFLSSHSDDCIHPKSGCPGCPDSANYLDFPQSYSLRTRKTTKFSLILSGRANALKMCQSVVNKFHKCLMNMFLVSDSPTVRKNVVKNPLSCKS